MHQPQRVVRRFGLLPQWARSKAKGPRRGPCQIIAMSDDRQSEDDQLHPLVPPQVLHFMQVPLRTSV